MKTVLIILAVIFGVFVLLFCVLTLVGYHTSVRRWNHGKCPKCGTPWKYWGTNTYGDRLCYCPNCLTSRTIVFDVDVDYDEEGGES